MAARASGPRGLPLTGNLLAIRKDVLGFLESLRAHGPVARVRIGTEAMHVVNDPALAREVLRAGPERFQRVTRHNRKLRDITGRSVLTTDGSEWRARRRHLSAPFGPAAVRAAVPGMAELTAETIARWLQATGPVDAGAAMQALTCGIIVRLLAHCELGAAAARVEPALAAVLAHHQRRVNTPLDLPHRLPTRSRAAFRKGVETIDAVVAEILTSGESPAIEALRAGEQRGELAARDELVTLFLAGHETTATALAWSLTLLAQHPVAQAAVREEARTVLGARQPSANDLKRLRLARQVFQETLRLYPPIWLLDREAVGAQSLGEYVIPDGSTVIVAPWLLHRDPLVWDQPEVFRPERFCSPAPIGSYLPFGDGPHACLGGGLALAEGPLIIALLARDLQWRLAPRFRPVLDPGLTLRMRRPLRLVVEAVA